MMSYLFAQLFGLIAAGLVLATLALRPLGDR